MFVGPSKIDRLSLEREKGFSLLHGNYIHLCSVVSRVTGHVRGLVSARRRGLTVTPVSEKLRSLEARG